MNLAQFSQQAAMLRRIVEYTPPSASEFTPEEMARLKTDYLFFAERCLKVRDKRGELVPFVLNNLQLEFHERIEKQNSDKGWVRAIALKGRQFGISTYIQGRYFWKIVFGEGIQATILTHEDKATKNLFAMAKRFLDKMPPSLAPPVNTNNANQLLFEGSDCGYTVGTARAKATGRSQTNRLAHLSEVAFFPEGEDHAAGLMQTVPELSGTEVILESTGKGVGNFFHESWKKAVRGEGDYIAVFLPWFRFAEYRRPVPAGFELTDEESELLAAYRDQGMTVEALVWRRAKIANPGKGEGSFKEEYPCTPSEAFTSTSQGFIKAEAVVRARAATIKRNEDMPLIYGVDPNGSGKDRFAIIARQGSVAFGLEFLDNMASEQQIGRLAVILRDLNRNRGDRMNIDVTGVGHHIPGVLKSFHGGDGLVFSVKFGGVPIYRGAHIDTGAQRTENDMYGGGPANRVSEMWMEMGDWLQGVDTVKIPDSDELQDQLVNRVGWPNAAGKFQLEPKEDMKRRKLASPDAADALALTFAERVVVFSNSFNKKLDDWNKGKTPGQSWTDPWGKRRARGIV
jgi:hypothetical protein